MEFILIKIRERIKVGRVWFLNPICGATPLGCRTTGRNILEDKNLDFWLLRKNHRNLKRIIK